MTCCGSKLPRLLKSVSSNDRTFVTSFPFRLSFSFFANSANDWAETLAHPERSRTVRNAIRRLMITTSSIGEAGLTPGSRNSSSRITSNIPETHVMTETCGIRREPRSNGNGVKS